MNKSYKIKYRVYLKDNSYYDKEGIISKCSSDIHAKVKLEEILKKNFENFNRLEIKSCEEDINIVNFFNDIFKGFKS
jgi:hypothetical protein